MENYHLEKQSEDEFRLCFSGQKLYGDDFSDADLLKWYRDEEEAYATLVTEQDSPYEYVYHAINNYHGYRYLPDSISFSALGIGSAYGHEFFPISSRLSKITILDPSEKFIISEIGGVPVSYRKPHFSGIIEAKDGEFDIFTCFGVLHHIPNVSFVISELARVTAAGGYGFIREPVSSMGDWRRPRRGLTPHERGIPQQIADESLRRAGFQIVSKTPCFFMPAQRIISKIIKTPYYNSKILVALDTILSKSFEWNMSYPRDSWIKKISPACYFWVVRKQA